LPQIAEARGIDSTQLPESSRTVFNDRNRKLFSFRTPVDKIGVLTFDLHGIYVGIGRDETEISAQIQRYSIDACIRRFKDRLYKTNSKKRITVNEFRVNLYRFLIKYWQYYRERRRSVLHKMNQYSQEIASKQSEFVPPSTFEVKLLVAGFNEGEQEGHVFPIWLTDHDQEWLGPQYRGTLDSVEMIPSSCGVYCDGVINFAMPVLAADDPMESFKQFQQDEVKAIVAEIADIKTRLSINCVNPPDQRPLFSGIDIPMRDGVRIAQLLIGGTEHYLGEKGGVGGATRICTINQLRGTKCRSRA